MAKRKVIWSRRAQIKLSDILQFYTERNGTKTYSVKLYAKISKSVKLLEMHPEIGYKTDFENVRALIVDSYIVYYENLRDKTMILTVWDCTQNPTNLKIK